MFGVGGNSPPTFLAKMAQTSRQWAEVAQAAQAAHDFVASVSFTLSQSKNSSPSSGVPQYLLFADGRNSLPHTVC